MKSRTHVNILGVEILLATIAYATSTVPQPIILDWKDYFDGSGYPWPLNEVSDGK